MKKVVLWTFAGILIAVGAFFGFMPKNNANTATVIEDSTKIKWHSFEEAMTLQEKTNKKMFIDFYTSWCGWCKVMDQKTFTNQDVIDLINDNFIAVKFDAEQKKSIDFKGKNYKFVNAGRRGIHELAYYLMQGQASYPSFVVLNENMDYENMIKGYKTPEQFIGLLDDHLAAK